MNQYTVNATPDSNWFVFFDGKGNGFDAGLDRGDVRNGTASNVISVSGLAQCQNACVANAWCKSFTMMGSTQCYQRKDFNPQHFPDLDSNGNVCRPYSDGAAVNCRCGLKSGSLTECNGFTAARDGTDGTGNTSYVKKQFSMSVACPESCSSNPSCSMVTYDNNGNCNQYRDPPTQRVADGGYTSVWNFNKFPR